MDAGKIIDKINEASRVKQKMFKIKSIEKDVFDMENKCGSCSKWMTNQCPRESRKHKVSCIEMKCNVFAMSYSSYETIKANNNN